MSFICNSDTVDKSALNEVDVLEGTKIKQKHSTGDLFKEDESYLEHSLVNKTSSIQKTRLQTKNNDFHICILCIRTCPAGSEVKFSSSSKQKFVNLRDAQQKLSKALGLLIKLQNHVMCPTCWNMIQLINDFRQCCEKVAKNITVFANETSSAPQKDDWLTEGTLHAIELKRQMIRKHMQFLDAENLKLNKKARQNKSTRKKEHDPLSEQLDDPNKEQANITPSSPTGSNATLSVPLQEGDCQINVIQCETCGRNFDGYLSIRAHKTHCKPGVPSKEKYFSCPICTATFIENSGLTFHMNKHKGIRPFKCRKFCDHTFHSNYNRIKHERRYCEKEGRICDVCGMHLKNEGSLLKHIENVHGEAKHSCNICGRKFRSSKNHRLHKRVHSEERKYVCTVCNKAFKAPYSLNVHKRIHTQELPFACHLCVQAFNYKVSLKNHIQRHHVSNKAID